MSCLHPKKKLICRMRFLLFFMLIIICIIFWKKGLNELNFMTHQSLSKSQDLKNTFTKLLYPSFLKEILTIILTINVALKTL